MDSIWLKTVSKPQFDALGGNKNTDVLIIGGGIAGILCAYKLKNAGVDCMLVEATEICGGITKNTTAKITLGHGLIYDKMIKRFGEDKARLYAEAQSKAIKEYAKLCKNIDCDFKTRDNYVYSLDYHKKIEKEVAALNRIGIKGEFSETKELPFTVAGAVRVKDQAQFHPLKFLYTIAKDLPIYEHTKVTELMPHKAKTNHGEITYKKLIIATHFPMINKHGSYFLKLYQHRSYVIALKGAQTANGMYVDESDTGLSFRNYGDPAFHHFDSCKGYVLRQGDQYADLRGQQDPGRQGHRHLPQLPQHLRHHGSRGRGGRQLQKAHQRRQGRSFHAGRRRRQNIVISYERSYIR